MYIYLYIYAVVPTVENCTAAVETTRTTTGIICRVLLPYEPCCPSVKTAQCSFRLFDMYCCLFYREFSRINMPHSYTYMCGMNTRTFDSSRESEPNESIRRLNTHFVS